MCIIKLPCHLLKKKKTKENEKFKMYLLCDTEKPTLPYYVSLEDQEENLCSKAIKNILLKGPLATLMVAVLCRTDLTI